MLEFFHCCDFIFDQGEVVAANGRYKNLYALTAFATVKVWKVKKETFSLFPFFYLSL